jgi:hypothetical protein
MVRKVCVCICFMHDKCCTGEKGAEGGDREERRRGNE